MCKCVCVCVCKIVTVSISLQKESCWLYSCALAQNFLSLLHNGAFFSLLWKCPYDNFCCMPCFFSYCLCLFLPKIYYYFGKCVCFFFFAFWLSNKKNWILFFFFSFLNLILSRCVRVCCVCLCVCSHNYISALFYAVFLPHAAQQTFKYSGKFH